ncbi:MAG: hypothetical protein LBG10_02900 [Treponema sp.]|jgi:hypothetical protein|nr:hypothetical protein [Treponema sp.]
MAKGKAGFLSGILPDRFSDAWKLLSETTVFLGRTKEFHLYEHQLRLWRSELQTSPRNSEAVQKIRSEIAELRKHLRLQGYDLSLGKQNLLFDGFRNDASLGEGFKRIVLFITSDDLLWLTGEDNHITLAALLERKIETAGSRKWTSIMGKHYLWYRRRGNDLILSGSDTETKEDYERLMSIGEANSLFFLSKLKSLW